MGYINIEGSDIYYEDSLYGEEILVCIHGFISSSICWHPLVEHLSKQFRVVAVDLPGFGQTVASRDYEFTLSNYGKTINRFVQELGFRKVHIVGHSLGGQIALQAVKQKPELYQKLFLIAASAVRKRPPWLARLFCYFPYVDEVAYRFFFQDEFVNIGISKVLAGGVGLEQEILRPYIDICKRKEVVQAVLKLGKMREDDMSKQDLNDIFQPAYLLWGREDQVVILEEGEFLHKHLKNSTLAIIEHCGHLPMEEYPTTVLHHLYSFLCPNFNNIQENN
ncbi:alpha/beta hydrolase [Anaerobacillus sp. CMMVII]|uniref:alpha/beta fold hydrolase n=1 Tax=Anaerobacillus sp. CMMVII TaxID=2755588 RepID=UPI0021B7C2A6|nr:alpha/beta hydrolase [Anaerobacillus sp. CMMVII]MCT8137377.1 alpha/beta hydrolase [Anaerobacillus sp. CMMVII]